MPSVKKNIILNGINTITSIIFPVITFPYAARVLLPEGIGAVNFLNSIIGYIVLITSLGIPMYAIKEVAKYRENKTQRDKITVEILSLSVILCILGYIVVWLLARFVPQIYPQTKLFYVLSLTIVFTSIGVNWFYQGIEDFKFITVRAVIIRTLSALSLFIFVKDSSDLLIYGIIVVGSTVGNNILNFIHLRKYINWKNISLSTLHITKHIKPASKVFILNLIVSLYVQVNSIMLGFLSGDEAVGFFSAGTKISHIGLTIITSLVTVLLPRCAHLFNEGNINEFNILVNKSLNLTLLLAYPMTIGLAILATPTTLVFCGEEFASAIPVLLLNTPVIVLISLNNLMGIQILYPINKIEIVIWSGVLGAVLNICFNIWLIPKMEATGAALATLITEFSVIVFLFFKGRKYYPFGLSDILNIKYLLGSLIMGVSVYFSIISINLYYLKLIVGAMSGVIIYFTFLLIVKDKYIIEIKSIILKKFRI